MWRGCREPWRTCGGGSGPRRQLHQCTHLEDVDLAAQALHLRAAAQPALVDGFAGVSRLLDQMHRLAHDAVRAPPQHASQLVSSLEVRVATAQDVVRAEVGVLPGGAGEGGGNLKERWGERDTCSEGEGGSRRVRTLGCMAGRQHRHSQACMMSHGASHRLGGAAVHVLELGGGVRGVCRVRVCIRAQQWLAPGRGPDLAVRHQTTCQDLEAASPTLLHADRRLGRATTGFTASCWRELPHRARGPGWMWQWIRPHKPCRVPRIG